MYNLIPIIDAHVHFTMQAGCEGLADFLTATGTDRANIVTVPHSRMISQTPAALVMKQRYEGRFYVFGALDPAAYFLEHDALGEYMAEYARKLRAMGCDGVKMLEGKPQMRKLLPVPDFDDVLWEPFWAYAEATALPILMHINDPEAFWNADVPVWAKAQGWFYDESFVNNEAQYTQIINVLTRHPRLKAIFAHFFFMSAQLPRLSNILESFPNVMVDMTPGIEMYENFSANIDGTQAFFKKYSDRIVYGTDIGGRCVLNGEDKPFNYKENLRRGEIVRRFISMTDTETVSSDGDFLINRADFLMKGLGLGGASETALLGENFRHCVGEISQVNSNAVLDECARLRQSFSLMAKKYPAFTPDTACVDYAEACFLKKSSE